MNFKQSIFEAISEGLKEDYQSVIDPLNLITHNSKYSFRWDLVNTNIKVKLFDSNLEVAVSKSGCWDFLLLLDPNTNQLYSLMNKKRFEQIIAEKTKNKGIPLYIQSLLLINASLKGKSEPTLFDLPPIEHDIFTLKYVLGKLCQNLSIEDFSDYTYSVIVFETDFNNNIMGLAVHTLDTNLDEVSVEDWLNETKPVMSTEIETVSNTEEKPLVKLSKKSEERKGNKEVSSIKESLSSNETAN